MVLAVALPLWLDIFGHLCCLACAIYCLLDVLERVVASRMARQLSRVQTRGVPTRQCLRELAVALVNSNPIGVTVRLAEKEMWVAYVHPQRKSITTLQISSSGDSVLLAEREPAAFLAWSRGSRGKTEGREPLTLIASESSFNAGLVAWFHALGLNFEVPHPAQT